MTVVSKSNQKKLETGSRFHIAGNLAEAERIYLKVLASEPANPLVHELLAKLYLARGELQKSDKHFARTLVFQPEHAECNWLRGVVLSRLGDLAGARKLILASLRKAPDNLQARKWLHSIYKGDESSTDLEAMVDNLEHLARLTNYDPALVCDEVELLERYGEIDRAAECIRQAQTHNPRDLWLLRDAMLLPPIMGDVASIAESRRQYEGKLDAMLERKIALSPSDAIPVMYFYLAYHGLNNRPLMQKLGTILGSQDFLCWRPSEKAEAAADRHTLKVGFCSTNFTKGHSVSNFCWELIERLADQPGVSVVAFAVVEDAAAASRVPVASSGLKTTILQRSNFQEARETIAREGLDVLIYPDVGMHSFTYLLAYSRLAPVQCVMLGHPDTTGIPQIDYYLSAATYETADAQDHYTEKLVRLKHGGLFFTRPPTASSGSSRADFGLPADRKLYFCPMMLQKIHPDFDRIVAAILDADPEAEVLFARDAGQKGKWSALLQSRFERGFSAEHRARIRFVPWQSRREDFIALLGCVDALLDSVHFGGGTTGLIAIAAGIPFVTWPGEFCRGRVISGLYRYIGVEDTIAGSQEDYVAMARRLANDKAWRNEVGERMRTNGQVLFDNPAAVEDLAATLFELAGKTPAVDAKGPRQ